MRLLPSVALVVCTGVFTALSVCDPALLGRNKFLVDFVNHNYVSILVVIVTVSLVSITQINLEYSRVERRFRVKVFEKPRRSLNVGAFILVAILIIGMVLAFLRAQFETTLVAVSFIHSIAILTILEVIFIMYDLIRTVYALASDEPVDGDEQG